MTITCSYNPKNEGARKGLLDIFACFKYKMYPELEEEFPGKYAVDQCFKMEAIEGGDDEDKIEYDFDFECKLPYGKYEDMKLLVRKKDIPEDDPSFEEKKDISPGEIPFIHWDAMPQPISVE
jgi:hypothetical protein